MENEYKLFLNLKDEMKSIYEKNLKNEEYDILINDDKMLLAKKENDKNINIEHEKQLLKLVESMAKRQSVKGIIYINLTAEINAILQRYKDIETINYNDKMVSWPIRQAFTKAIVIREEKKGI